MRPPKPSSLVTRDETKAARAARTSAEATMTPRTALTRKPPAVLTGRKVASATWKRLVGLYAELDGTIVTAFDHDLLAKYCLLQEELVELADMRTTIKKEWQAKLKEAAVMKRSKLTTETVKDYLHLCDIANALFARFQGMDARMDGKRKLGLAYEQSLYITPRSRAGVAPPEKEPEPPKSEMDDLLNTDD